MWIIRFTVTGFSTQSLYDPQIIPVTSVKIVGAIMADHISFVVIVAFVGRKEKYFNKKACSQPRAFTQK
jgi:hypothetical protein